MKIEYKITILMILIILVSGIYVFGNIKNSQGASLNSTGSDEKGYITKEIYSSPGSHQIKIAVITGIHPREKLAIDPVKDVLKNYSSTHDVEITNYIIHVQDHPDDFTISRNNGEYLAAQYIVPAIKKSNYNLVIICHAHQLGYGSGYFIATPAMDNRSVDLAENVKKMFPQLNYYKATNATKHSTSAIRVSNPIAESGTPVFVYEVPEWKKIDEAQNMTYKLIDVSIDAIKSNRQLTQRILY